MTGTYPEYLLLQKGATPPKDPHATGVRVYADADGFLRVIQSDGTDTAIGSGGGSWGEGSTAHFSGNGSPVNSVLPEAKGDLYVDVTTPALYQATGLSNADWVAVPHVIQGIAPGDEVLTIRAPNNQTAHALTVVNADNDDCFSVGGTSGATLSADAVGGTSELQITTNVLTFKDENGDVMVDIEGGYVSLGSAGAVFVTPNNYLAVNNHAAPADGELSAGDCALWFDQTNDAAKLMVKAKTANGTVVTGSLALAP